jgi:hypothetical protein
MWRLSLIEVHQEGLEPLDRAYDLPGLSGGVKAVERGDCSMQQCPLHPATIGDPRGTTRILNHEAVYDYNYAAATREYGPAFWMDVRNAAVCPAVNAYRQSLLSPTALPHPPR